MAHISLPCASTSSKRDLKSSCYRGSLAVTYDFIYSHYTWIIIIITASHYSQTFFSHYIIIKYLKFYLITYYCFTLGEFTVRLVHLMCPCRETVENTVNYKNMNMKNSDPEWGIVDELKNPMRILQRHHWCEGPEITITHPGSEFIFVLDLTIKWDITIKGHKNHPTSTWQDRCSSPDQGTLIAVNCNPPNQTHK